MPPNETMEQEKRAVFTPGPWEVREPRQNGTIPIRSADRPPQLIAEVIQSDREHTAEANARLIGVAPEMYEALRGLLDAYSRAVGSDDDAFSDYVAAARAADERARAALAKAEGRSA